jgi:hypothetical protein
MESSPKTRVNRSLSAPPPELYELTRIFFDLQARGLRVWDEYHRSDDLRALQAYASFVRAVRAHLGLVEDNGK